MMKRWILGWTCCLILGLHSVSQAHFVWLKTTSDGDGKQVHVVFGESPDVGEAHLVERITQTQLQGLLDSGKVALLATQAQTSADGEKGWLAADLPADATGEVLGICEYGVFSRGDQRILLHYYAKTLLGGQQPSSSVDPSVRLPLDVQPSQWGSTVKMRVLWHGQPIEGSEVVVTDPEGVQHELVSDADGLVQFPAEVAGRYDLRARWLESKTGEHQGQAYDEVRHYCTATWDQADTSPQAAAPSAADILARARAARAVWNDFPGFTAQVRVTHDGIAQEGELRVASDGDLQWSGIELTESEPITRSLESLVSHRLGSGAPEDEVVEVEPHQAHPLGRLIDIGDASGMGSTYRIDGDLIRQVNRQMGPQRLTISVLDFYRNPEGNVIPETYQVLLWNQDGSLARSDLVEDQWVRVGEFDLPRQHLTVSAGPDAYRVFQVEFFSHELLDAQKP